MGGMKYETPYPVKKADGSQIIWDWGTKSWGPYDPGRAAKGPTEVGFRAPDSDPNPGESSAPSMSGTADTNTGGATAYQMPRRRTRLSSDDTYAPGRTLLTPRNDR